MPYDRVERHGQPAVLVASLFCYLLCIACGVVSGSTGWSDLVTKSDRARLSDAIAASSLGLDAEAARLLAESVPDNIVRKVLRRDGGDPAEVSSTIACISLTRSGVADSTVETGEKLCVCSTFKGPALYYAVLGRDGPHWMKAWDTTLTGSLSVPFVWQQFLGSESGKYGTIISFGQTGREGSWVLIDWDGIHGRIVSEITGNGLKPVDIERDGVMELSVQAGDRFSGYHEEIYAFDRGTATFKLKPGVKSGRFEENQR